MENNNQSIALAANQQSAKNINVSQVLVVQPPKREPLEVGKFNTAVKSADRGKRAQLYEQYDQIIKDPVVGESIRKRIRAVTNGGLKFLTNNEEVDEMTDFIKTPQFRKLLREIMLTIFYGKTVVELYFTPSFSIAKIPRKHLDTSKKVILRQLSDSEGIPYENDDFLLNLGEDDDLGLLMEVAPPAIFKRNGWADYADFCEMWGIPTVAWLYDPEDEQGKSDVDKIAQERGGNANVVMSNKGDVKTLDGSSNGAVHDTFTDKLDNQILIALIGQTMTTKDGSSLSQSITHLTVSDEISSDDIAYVLEILNYEVLPRLEKRGYPVKNGWFVFPEKDNLTLKDKLAIAKDVDNITEDGVDDDYFYETFGLPKSKVNKKKEVTPDPQNPVPQNPEPGKKQPKKVTAKELSFFQKLKDFFDQAPL